MALCKPERMPLHELTPTAVAYLSIKVWQYHHDLSCHFKAERQPDGTDAILPFGAAHFLARCNSCSWNFTSALHVSVARVFYSGGSVVLFTAMPILLVGVLLPQLFMPSLVSWCLARRAPLRPLLAAHVCAVCCPCRGVHVQVLTPRAHQGRRRD